MCCIQAFPTLSPQKQVHLDHLSGSMNSTIHPWEGSINEKSSHGHQKLPQGVPRYLKMRGAIPYRPVTYVFWVTSHPVYWSRLSRGTELYSEHIISANFHSSNSCLTPEQLRTHQLLSLRGWMLQQLGVIPWWMSHTGRASKLLSEESGYLKSPDLSPKPWRIPGERWSSVNKGCLKMLVLVSLKKPEAGWMNWVAANEQKAHTLPFSALPFVGAAAENRHWPWRWVSSLELRQLLNWGSLIRRFCIKLILKPITTYPVWRWGWCWKDPGWLPGQGPPLTWTMQPSCIIAGVITEEVALSADFIWCAIDCASNSVTWLISCFSLNCSFPTEPAQLFWLSPSTCGMMDCMIHALIDMSIILSSNLSYGLEVWQFPSWLL